MQEIDARVIAAEPRDPIRASLATRIVGLALTLLGEATPFARRYHAVASRRLADGRHEMSPPTQRGGRWRRRQIHEVAL